MDTPATVSPCPPSAYHTYPWLKFNHDHYYFSEFRARASVLAKAAYLDLTCLAMKQTPALSIPDDDTVLAAWLGLTPVRWQRIRAMVLSQFELNPEDGRYYSRMLLDLYDDEAAASLATGPRPQRARTSTERVRRHRAARQQALAGSTETAPETPPETPSTVSCNADETPQPVSGNAADVSSHTEKTEESKTNKNSDAEVAHEASATHAAITFAMHFDWQPYPASFALLLAKLQIAPDACTPARLVHFISHYRASHALRNQDQWELLLAQWLKRERPVRTTTPGTERTRIPVVLVDERPQWQIFEERKARAGR